MSSRESEIVHRKKENAVSLSADGSLKFAKETKDVVADVQGELKVRQCLQRRAIAYHL